MSLTKKDKKDIGEIVAVTISEYHRLDVKPEFNKIHETLAKHSEMLNKHSETLTKHSDTLARLESDVSDVNRKLTDLSMDTPSRSEFNKHGQKIQKLERELGFV
ncbi:MAG: hypothetical protein AAB856_00505 [Patescibacteria group bacterium]